MTSSQLVPLLERTLMRRGPDMFADALGKIVAHFGAQMGTLHRLAEDRHLVLVAATAGIPEPVLAAARRIPVGKGIAGEAAETGKPVSLCNLQTAETVPPGARATGAGGALCVPVFLGERVVGTLGIGSLEERVFTPEETEELAAAARTLAALLARTV